ncbi:MAG: putative ribonuclease [Bacteroidetes bacterium]|nr:putative ribonuclease [Bacteroidota bacterium]
MQIKKTFSKTGTLLKETFIGFIDDNAIKLAASLSYFTIFALPPLLIVIISLCGIFLGKDAVRGEIFGQINGLVGNEAALQIQNIIKNVKLNSDNVFAATVGVITLLIGASGVFGEIQSSINSIWGLKAKPKRGIMKFLKNRLMSFSMIGSMGFLLLVGLIINSVMDILNTRLAHRFPQFTIDTLYVVNLVLVFAIITSLFCVIFKTLPDGKVALKDALIGSSITAFLFMFGKFAIGAYLGRSTISSTYGAAGSVILILLWVYYSAIILYFGAEFTKVYSRLYGSKIIPNDYAVQVETQATEVEPAVVNHD